MGSRDVSLRSRRARVGLLGLVLLLGTGAPALAAPHAATVRPAPVERTIEVDGLARAYLVDVPQGCDQRTPAALLLVFHGARSTAETLARVTGFGPWADASPTLIVYPRARAGLRQFDAGGTRVQPSPDVRFVDALLARLRERFALDPARVYATGFRSGAAFCFRLAADRSNVIAAIAPVHGAMPESVTEAPTRRVPTPAVDGLGAIADAVSRQDLKGFMEVLIREWKWARWNARGPVAREVGTTDAGLRWIRLTHGDPAGHAVVMTLTLTEEGNVWSGGPGGLVSREVWTFLRAHTLPPPAASAVAPGR